MSTSKYGKGQGSRTEQPDLSSDQNSLDWQIELSRAQHEDSLDWHDLTVESVAVPAQAGSAEIVSPDSGPVAMDASTVASASNGDARGPDGFVDPIVEALNVSPDDSAIALQQAASLMRLDQVRSNSLFSGVNGQGQTVVVIDTGADLDHSAFGSDANSDGISDRIVYQTNFVGTNGGNATDGHGHGTHVAGIVGSQNSTYTGMAPGSNIIVLRVLDNNGSGNSTDIEEAWQWVVANRSAYNIVAVSMSIQNNSNNNTDQATVIADEVATLTSAGIASVICAGNYYSTYNAPGANYWGATTGAWGVASTLDNANTFSDFSQRSTTMTEIAAPGSNITSAYLNNGYATLSGTSMATPMISGLVALSQDLSQQITGGTRMTPAQILNIMRSTGVNITDGTSTVPRVDALNLMNGVVSHWQQYTGNADRVYGWRGNDSLFGGNGNDTISANSGDDTVTGGANDDTIDGGVGTDTAVFSGNRSAYTITALSATSFRVVGSDGTDTLSNVEFARFSDQTVSLTAPDDYADSLTDSTAPFGNVAVGGSATGSIEFAGDRDWFRVQLTAGMTYVLNEEGSPTSRGTLSDSYLRLRDSSGTLLTENDDAGVGLNARLIYTASYTGTYYLEAGEFGDNATGAYTLSVTSGFAPANLASPHFGGSGGWSSDDGFPREMADVNGDGRADIVGFASAATYVALANSNGTFGTPFVASPHFAGSGGWTSDDTFPREMGDVNGDGRADIVGFANAATYVALSNSDGTFGTPFVGSTGFAGSGGWSSEDAYPRQLADVNGDGRADIVGFAQAGVYVALGTSSGNFASAAFASTHFGSNEGWASDNIYPREMADVNGDGRDDIIGFAAAGTYVALASSSNPGTFNEPTLASTHFGTNEGWSSDDLYRREVADVNRDGRADIIGFANAGVYVALGTSSGAFGEPGLTLAGFTPGAGGWSSDNTYPREVADVNGDGAADIVGFANAGTYVSLSEYFLT